MTSGDESYADQLGDVLRKRDPGALRDFLVLQAGRYGDDRQVAEIEARSDDEITTLLHRMIVTRPDLEALHADSRSWLAERGSLPPDLPESVRRRTGRSPGATRQQPRKHRPRPKQ